MMDYEYAYATDIGRVKDKNQDAFCIRKAKSARGNIVMIALCDGMGGLAMGELASGSVIHAFTQWFEQELSYHIQSDTFQIHDLQNEIDELLIRKNHDLSVYGREHQLQLGTTCTMMLLIDNTYMIAHIGDTRAYYLSDMLQQLTEDHTLVERLRRQHQLSDEDAQHDSRKNVLLQCIGASAAIRVQYVYGTVHQGDAFLLCSDGFRHELRQEEIFVRIKDALGKGQEEIRAQLTYLIELNKKRMENDNITSMVVFETSGGDRNG